MKFYEPGDTVFIAEKEYLVLEEGMVNGVSYLTLGTHSKDFMLEVASQHMEGDQIVLGLVKDEELKDKLLAEIVELS